MCEQGVSVIDFSPANNLLVTGSRDCVIRGWNPCSENPVMVLRGHEAPVIFLCVNEIKVSAARAHLNHCQHFCWIWPINRLNVVALQK